MAASPEQALRYAEAHMTETLAALKVLASIPSISARPAPDPEVRRSADCVAAWMKRVGLEKVEVLELDGAHPYVYGEHVHAGAALTALLYAHHDVQPIGRESHWKSPPFVP